MLLGGAGHPVEGSVVTAVHLDSGELFKSVPAGRDGSYAIKGLPYGYYSFAIEADGVLHAAPGPTNLVPSQREQFDFLLRRPAVASSHDAPSIGTGTRLPGLAQAATGTAEIVGLPSEVPFARTPAGIATIVGSVVLALLLLG